ncbi:MAG: Bax inhibitor-1/YccA family protein [Candidatus Marinimicrobia bacterium]|nr:Bax inhibitor-1/YccA family protein [Candidatus Neomarinimicrobiota bacterium]
MNNLRPYHNTAYTGSSVRSDVVAEAQKEFVTKVFGWMTAALVVTGVVAKGVFTSEVLQQFIFGTPFVFIGLIIAELGLVVYLSAAINRMSAATATWAFLAYSALNGLTLSVIFMAFTSESLASTFIITAAMFGAMAAWGYFTKKDLTGMGSLAFMGLIGILIASVVNLFLRSEGLYWIVSYVGVLVFTGLTAYDTQRIKEMAVMGGSDSESYQKVAVLGALKLYLDFINLFIMMLRIMGRRR